MSVEYRGNVVTCEYSFPDGKAAKGVYTCVIGTVLIDNGELDVRLCGLTTAAGSGNTPWIERKGAVLIVTFDGSPLFKKGGLREEGPCLPVLSGPGPGNTSMSGCHGGRLQNR